MKTFKNIFIAFVNMNKTKSLFNNNNVLDTEIAARY